MGKCDCCCKVEHHQHHSHRPWNYQKLVENKLPRFGSIFGKEDGHGPCHNKHQRVPCSLSATTRDGTKCTIPMDCDKFGKLKVWHDPCKVKHREFLVCVPKKEPVEEKKLVVCMPCDKGPSEMGNVKVYLSHQDHPQPKPKYRDYMYRCESRELLGSKLLAYCQCVKRNGLQDRCPRTPCQGRPACLVKPWPDCWPSGGCHGQDYDRPKGVARVNPTLQYRRDHPHCGPHEQEPEIRVMVCSD